MTNDAEYFFMSLLATRISSLEKCQFQPPAFFFFKLGYLPFYC